MELLDGNRLKLQLSMEPDQMYVARLEPYRLFDLEKLLDEIRDNSHVEGRKIGKTVEGRDWETWIESMLAQGPKPGLDHGFGHSQPRGFREPSGTGYQFATWVASHSASGTHLAKSVIEAPKPDFMIDFHNDESGRLHISRPNVDLEPYLARMKRFESLLWHGHFDLSIGGSDMLGSDWLESGNFKPAAV